MENKITLYQFESCPWCVKVRNKLDELGFKYKKVNMIRNREDSERKIIPEKSGVLTVPVVNIDGEFIGESSVIIKKLEEIIGIKHKSFFTKFLTKLKLTKSTNQ